MLSVQKTQRRCLTCCHRLLSLFEINVKGASIFNPALLRQNTRDINRAKISRYGFHQKSFTSVPKQSNDIEDKPLEREHSNGESLDSNDETRSQGSPEDKSSDDNRIEATVRQARQTFGETLPSNFLTSQEYALYERLFGPPTRETTADDLEFIPGEEEEPSAKEIRSVLLQQNQKGELEEIDIHPTPSYSVVDKASKVTLDKQDKPTSEEQKEKIQYVAKNKREVEAMVQLQADMKAAAELPDKDLAGQQEVLEYEEEEEELDDEEVDDDLYVSSDAARTHPHTMEGRSRSNPSTINLPNKSFVAPITKLLDRTKNKHLQLAAEKAFGGKGLPFSSSVPVAMKNLPQREIGLDASQNRMSEIEADAYMAAVMPGTYTAIMSSLVEVRKRLGQSWLRDLMIKSEGDGPKVLDAGAGGAGIIAWRKIMEAEWEIMKEDGTVQDNFNPLGKSSVVTGSDTLRHRASKLLENTTFLPRLPDYVHSTFTDNNIDSSQLGERKIFDVVLAPHTLLPQKEDYKRRNMVKNLWSLVNPNGGVLVIIEKGLPRGFEAVADARSLILSSFISSPGDRFVENDIESAESNEGRYTEKEEGMIIAPCTSHSTCPMYPSPGISSGRKDFCHFPQRFIRPPFLQRLLGAKVRNHEDVKFSYIAFRRGIDERKASKSILLGEDATKQSFEGYEHHNLPEAYQDADYIQSDISFSPLSLPRVILPPLKRHGHVTLDLCTPSGKIERWTVPKSFSSVAYRDARKSKWGDLWALGAKTRVERNLRLGKIVNLKGQKAKHHWDEALGKKTKKVKKYNIVMGSKGFEGIRSAGKAVEDRGGKRNKGGRLSKGPKPISVDDL
ncbi:37S ribosomal protein Rsm22 [Blumeria hordei DH14]|uniref:37S ribosomal protein Rsm22 n=1 Tax=Blumeria graminis f. sp. hordei (strain DH14) TaxID=546991 RepID=N1JAX3_BLUG1|nr:37S ribosomal protein Rsm22 [Blumeria hordei DH14]